MLGGSPSEVLKEVLQDAGDEVEEDPFGAGLSLQREELVGQMVEVCRQQLYPYYDPYQVDGWALCEPAGMRLVVAMAMTLVWSGVNMMQLEPMKPRQSLLGLICDSAWRVYLVTLQG